MTQGISKVSMKVWGGGASSCKPYSSLNVKIFKESSQPLANVRVPKNQATSKMVELAMFSFISLQLCLSSAFPSTVCMGRNHLCG